MEWTLAIVAGVLLGVGAISKKLTNSPITPTMVFVAVGVLVGPQVLDGIDVRNTSSVGTLAEASLALVLFSDASRINLGSLRQGIGVPSRLLGLGLPLTIILGTLVATFVFDQFTPGEALILSVILAPTDAALGQAVVTDRHVPARIRQGLNVESGLNDGICVPLLFAAVALADVESHIDDGRGAIQLLVQEIGFGALAGVLAGALLAFLFIRAGRRGLIAGRWKQVMPVAGAGLAFGLAAALGGSGFIAAFVAGIAFRRLLGRDPAELNELTDEFGDILSGVTFLLFGALFLGPALGQVSWEIVLYAILSLTAVRMVPVALAMIGSHARRPTVGFLGWFGPRGLASIAFAVIVVEESNLPNQELIVLVVSLTVGLSVFAHGLSAVPLAQRYGRWFETHPKPPSMESAPAEVSRTRKFWGTNTLP